MKALRLAPGLDLPPDFATQGVAVVGVRGSGKSNSEVRWAELLYEAGIPWVAIDPKGDWWGVQSSADGKKPGLSVPVFGGLHGNFPLEPAMGAAIADLLVDHMLSAVLDVSRLSKTGGQIQFLLGFFRRLMDRHQVDPHVRCVILEEAHRYIPQQVDARHAELKEAAAAVLLEGRSWGLGCWACTQRPARLNKDVLEEVTNVILHGLGVAASNDKKTVKDWTQHYEVKADIMASLNDLAPGEAWILSPQVLKMVRRVQIDRRRTFDSGATPEVGAATRRPSTLADVDAGAIKEALVEAIDRAKAEDPKELRRRIAELERSLRDAQRATPAPVVERVEVPVLGEAAMSRLTALLELADDVRELRQEVGGVLERWAGRSDLSRARPAGDRPRPVAAREPAPQRADPPARREPGGAAVPGAAEGARLGKAPRLILTALAQYPQGRTTRQVAFLTGYSVQGGGFRNPLSALRTEGYVEGGLGGAVLRITDLGLAALGSWEPLPTGRALAEFWLASSQLGHAEREILRVLIDVWPDSLPVAEVAARTTSSKGEPYDPAGGGFRNPLSRLRTLELVEGRAELRASDDLVDG